MILELANDIQPLFERQPAQEKKRLLDYLLSNCTCDGAHLEVEFRQPFKIIAEDTQRVDLENDSRSDDLGDYEKWLPLLNEYRTICIDPPAEILYVFQASRDVWCGQ